MSHSAAKGPAPADNVADLEADIRQTRQQLGETVQALEEKLDVTAQLKNSTDHARHRAAEIVHDHGLKVAVVAIYAALVTVAWKKL